MKKLFACLLVLILTFSMSFMTASAAPSPEANGIISGIEATDANGDEAYVELIKIDGKVKDYFQNGLKDLKKEIGDNTLKVVAQYKVKVVGDPVYDLDVILNVLGISKSSKVYLMVKEGAVENTSSTSEAKVINLSNVYDLKATNLAKSANGVVSFAVDAESGKISFTLEEGVQSLAIVTDGKTAANVEKENDILSPQTSENFDVTPYVAVIALISVLAIAILPKKIKNV